MRRRRRIAGMTVSGLVLALLVGSALGTGGYTAWYGEGFSYLSNDPAACVNCHIMREQYDGWRKASHHGAATCNDCHTPHDFVGKYLTKAENGFWHSKGFTLQDFHEPIRIRESNARVLQQGCLHCHAEAVSEIVGHAPDESLRCVHCHASVGHGPPR